MAARALDRLPESAAFARRASAGLAAALRRLACGAVPTICLAASAHAATLPPRGDMVGEVRSYLVLPDDTFVDIARRFDLGYVELLTANPGVDPWIPMEGSIIVLPAAHLLPDAPRQGIVINLSELRLYHFRRDGAVSTFPLGIGSAGTETPVGATRVVRKQIGPTWFPPPSILAERPWLPRAIPPGPDNPLGSHALYLGWPRIVIHGTNRPAGVGRRVSHGCIRLYPDDIAALFEAVPVGTQVTVVDQAVKLGWSGGELFLEVHPTQDQVDEVERTGRASARLVLDLAERAVAISGDQAYRLDWEAIRRAAAHPTGMPVRITR